MDYVEQRETNPEYLKTVIAQRHIVIEERERQISEQAKVIEKLEEKIASLEQELLLEKQSASNQINNLTMALKDNEAVNEALKHEKSELEFQLNVGKLKAQEREKEHTKETYKLKNDLEAQKESLNLKITKLEKNLTSLNSHYHVEESINQDKHKIIEDANRNLRGFANEKQQRMIIIQNQQLSNEIQYQSRQITSLLEKSEKLQDEIKQYKMELELHKNIENDLVKRSSLAQNLIKQLNLRIRELEKEAIKSSHSSQQPSLQKISDYSRVSSESASQANKDLQSEIAKLRFENANLKNYNHFLETSQKVNNNKYQTLGEIMAQYLQGLLFKHTTHADDLDQITTLDIKSLKQRDLKEWTVDETEAILQLLIAQVKPYLSKASLTSFPEVKNIKVSFVEEQSREALALPKIVEDLEENYEKEMKKPNRFKDIPVDISTKILRSNLREWGAKVSFGQNIPRSRKVKSKSIVPEMDRSIL